MNEGTSHNNTDDDDSCPLTGGAHKYFIFKTMDWYEPFSFSVEFMENYSEAFMELFDNVDQYYIKKEYAILGCNCGSVIRKEVIKK